MFKFELRERVQDTITHFTGYITMRAETVSRGNTYAIETISTDGIIIQAWLGEERLKHA